MDYNGQEIYYYFSGCEAGEQEVKVTLSLENGFVRFDVDMDSLPQEKNKGYEVIVEFSVDEFRNNQTFWTDSNGLEMQKRVLNYRPTWDITNNYKDSKENITANFYTVNSAISMYDGDR